MRGRIHPSPSAGNCLRSADLRDNETVSVPTSESFTAFTLFLTTAEDSDN
jgi:hypothetical protein